ncbi:MAG: geranylgeranyl reductase family protein [Candidatus Thorarchaeota archaeon]
MYDVVISGAGPSGSKCAEILSKEGFKIALLEKDINWRKPCGGAIHHRAFNLIPQLKKLNIPKIKGIIMHSADYHKLEYRLPGQKYGTVMDRLEFDNLIRNVAIDQGVDFFNKNLSFDFITKEKKRIGIKTKTSSGIKEYFGKILIIADGMSSKLAPKSGLRSKWKTEHVALAKCAILEGHNQLDEEYIYTYFKPYKGYGWIFPLDDKRFNIGLFTFGKDNFKYNLSEIYNKFFKNPHIKKYLSSLNYKTIWTSAFPFPTNGVLEKSLYDNNIMLIGDTGGFVSPISGEGIHTAIISGKIAAGVAINALQQEDYSINMLKKYKLDPEVKKIIRNFKFKRSMVKFFYENKGENLNKLLMLAEKDKAFKGHVVDMFLSKSLPTQDFLSKIKNVRKE